MFDMLPPVGLFSTRLHGGWLAISCWLAVIPWTLILTLSGGYGFMDTGKSTWRLRREDFLRVVEEEENGSEEG